LTAAERTHAAVGGEAGAIVAGATASALIGAVYLAPAGYVARKVNSRLLVIVIGAAAGALAITLFALPALLSISTSAFVVAAAGASAIMMAKLMRRIFRMK
jgi:hypothetical protein